MTGVGTARPLLGGRYELEALIGKGGIGEVWRARHVGLNSTVAIKLLQGAIALRESARRRFMTEAQITAQLKTRHAVQVFDVGVSDDGQPYIVMELLEGETLGRRLDRAGRLSGESTVGLLGQCAHALQRAHQLGIVHRDFKPDNVILSRDHDGNETVKVVDFGIAKLVGELESALEEDADTASSPATSTFTRTGAILGTPYYMAPEQVRSASGVDLRADVWAFGVVAFECLAGRPPFAGANLVELFARIQHGEHPAAAALEPSLPAGFDDWFDIACAREPDARFPSAMVAWSRLCVSLGLDPNDVGARVSQSGPLGVGGLASSGERPIVVRGEFSHGDESARTLYARTKGSSSRVADSASFDDTFASLQRITLNVDDAPSKHLDAAREESVEAAPAVPRPAPSLGSSSRVRNRAAAAMALVVCVAAALLVARWRTSAVGAPQAAVIAVPTATLDSPPSQNLPSPKPSTSPLPSSSSASPPSAPPPPASSAASSAAAAASKPGAARSGPPPRPVVAASVPQTPAMQPSHAAAPTDPGSYR